MKIKLLLRFYCFADGLEAALNNRILKRACSTCGGGLETAESICNLIYEKSELSKLWNYLDGIISAMPKDDAKWLKAYAESRGGLNTDESRNIKRAVMKFVRRARGAGRFEEGIRLACKYYCLLHLSGRK